LSRLFGPSAFLIQRFTGIVKFAEKWLMIALDAPLVECGVRPCRVVMIASQGF